MFIKTSKIIFFNLLVFVTLLILLEIFSGNLIGKAVSGTLIGLLEAEIMVGIQMLLMDIQVLTGMAPV
mgnify:CR=1 FL=1